MYPKLKHPCTGIISGPSGSGKTHLTVKLINSDIYEPSITRIEWYCEKASKPEGISVNCEIEFIEKIPEKFVNESNEPLLIVLDDLMDESMQSVQVSKLYTKDARHSNISVILLTQNIYNPGKYSRNISLNSSFYILFRNLRDQNQINKFLQQICGGCNSKAIQSVYRDAVTNKPHSYLFIDFSQKGHNLLRFRTDLFGENGVSTVYCPAEMLNSENEAVTETTKFGQIYAIDIE